MWWASEERKKMLANTGSASMGANVNRGAARWAGLPLNGRQLSQLYLQAARLREQRIGNVWATYRFFGSALCRAKTLFAYDGHRKAPSIIGTARREILNGEIPTPFRFAVFPGKCSGVFASNRINFPAEYGHGYRRFSQINVS